MYMITIRYEDDGDSCNYVANTKHSAYKLYRMCVAFCVAHDKEATVHIFKDGIELDPVLGPALPIKTH